MTISHPSMVRVRDTSDQNPPKQEYVVDDATDQLENKPVTEADEGSVIYTGPGGFAPPGPPEVMPSPVSNPPQPIVTDKNMLESLIFLGKISDEVEISGFKFDISTLTHREHNLLMQELYKFGDGADLFTIRTLTMAHAVKKVNGKLLEEFVLEPEQEDLLETNFDKKLAIIDSMQMTVVEKLFDAYTELTNKSDSSLDGEKVKN